MPRQQLNQSMLIGVLLLPLPGYVRHPMYSGLIMAGIGLAAITRNECRLALTALLWVVLEQKVRAGRAVCVC